MTLDEAIRHCREVAEERHAEAHYSEDHANCEECAAEHEQLAEWLEELKQRRAAESKFISAADGRELRIECDPRKGWRWVGVKGVKDVTPEDLTPQDIELTGETAERAREAAERMREGRVQITFAELANEPNVYETIARVTEEQLMKQAHAAEIALASKRHPIIAVDFDGTLCENEWPGIGAPKGGTIQALIAAQAAGARLILWTNRIGARLREAVVWCQARELEFDAINENLPETLAAFTTDCRKVYADIYLDDKAAQPSTAVLEALWETARSVMNGEPEQPQACNPAHRGSATAEQFEAIWNDNDGEEAGV